MRLKNVAFQIQVGKESVAAQFCAAGPEAVALNMQGPLARLQHYQQFEGPKK